MHQTTYEDVQALLENFADYVNPAGEFDPWFTLPEINRQFVWDDVPPEALNDWLGKMVRDGQVEQTEQDGEAVYRWSS